MTRARHVQTWPHGIPKRASLEAVYDELVHEAAMRAAELILVRLSEIEEAESEFLTIPEAARVLRSKRQRVDDLLSAGRLRRVKDGRRTLIRRSDLAEYLAGRDAT